MNKMLRSTVVALVCAASVGLAAQGRGGKTATLAIMVTDPDGTGISAVLVTVSGPAEQSRRTEGGRMALEGLPPGTYRLRFEHERFVTLEREVVARAGAPIDVKVSLTPASAPPPPPDPPTAPGPVTAEDMAPVAIDLIAVIESEFVGRAPQRVSELTCQGDVHSTLIQLNQPLALHAHDATDETFYVIAGAGTAHFGGRQQHLKPGTFVFVPRGTPHSLSVSGRNPLVVLSTRSGEPCRN